MVLAPAGLSLRFMVAFGTGFPGLSSAFLMGHENFALFCIALGMTCVMSAAGIFLTFMLLTFETQIVMSIGVFFLAFQGSRYTAQYSQGYISYAINIGAKFFVFYFMVAVLGTVIGVGNASLPASLLSLAAGAVIPFGAGSIALVALSSPMPIICVVVSVLVAAIPNFVGSILSGSSALNAQNALNNNAMAAGLGGFGGALTVPAGTFNRGGGQGGQQSAQSGQGGNGQAGQGGGRGQYDTSASGANAQSPGGNLGGGPGSQGGPGGTSAQGAGGGPSGNGDVGGWPAANDAGGGIRTALAGGGGGGGGGGGDDGAGAGADVFESGAGGGGDNEASLAEGTGLENEAALAEGTGLAEGESTFGDYETSNGSPNAVAQDDGGGAGEDAGDDDESGYDYDDEDDIDAEPPDSTLTPEEEAEAAGLVAAGAAGVAAAGHGFADDAPWFNPSKALEDYTPDEIRKMNPSQMRQAAAHGDATKLSPEQIQTINETPGLRRAAADGGADQFRAQQREAAKKVDWAEQAKKSIGSADPPPGAVTIRVTNPDKL
jgi:hypothetical protein